MSVEGAEQDVAVTIPVYAAVKAATAEGFSLSEVLAIETIEPAVWRQSDLVWTQKIVVGDALASYKQELASAEDWLARKVSPLDAEPEAWLAFLAEFGGAGEPFAFLEGLGLTLNDLSRLRRQWDARVAGDSDLRSRFAKLQEEKHPLPPISVEPPVLKRSRRGEERIAEAPAIAEPATATHVPTAELGLEIYAMICAHLELHAHDAETLRRLGVATPEAREALHARWDKHFTRDPTLRRDFKLLLGHEKRRIAALDNAPPPRAPEAAAPRIEPTYAPATPAAPTSPVTAPLPVMNVRPAGEYRRRYAYKLPVAPLYAPPEAQRISLTLEQYASMLVELGLLPEFEVEVLERYGMTPFTREEHDAYYGAHIAHDPALRERLRVACEQYRAYLARGA